MGEWELLPVDLLVETAKLIDQLPSPIDRWGIIVVFAEDGSFRLIRNDRATMSTEIGRNVGIEPPEKRREALDLLHEKIMAAPPGMIPTVRLVPRGLPAVVILDPAQVRRDAARTIIEVASGKRSSDGPHS